MPQSIRSDERLVERASRGDRRALEAIFRRYHQELFRYCAALLGNSEDAGDALQNTMVKVLGALPGEERRLHLKPWLYRIAHNESIDLLRRQRNFEPIDAEALIAAQEPESNAETRERLRQLIVDLRELPERQRGSLVMRELGGLSFEQIGAAFETSAAVARQTVYEARIGLQEMERGREMECDEVRRKLSDGDRRVFRRRDLRAHLRQCSGCREFETAISRRHTDLAAISPISALAAAGLLKSVLGGTAGSAIATGAATGTGTAGSALSVSAAAKAVATVAAAGAIGVGAADRAGVVHVFDGGRSVEAPTAAEGNRPPGGSSIRRPAPVVPPQITEKAERARTGGGSVATARHAASPAAAGRQLDRTPESSEAPPAGVSPSRGHGPPSGNRGMNQGKAAGEGVTPANAHGGNPHANGGHHGKIAAGSEGKAHTGQGGDQAHANAPRAPAQAPNTASSGEPSSPSELLREPEAVQPSAHGKPES